MRTWRFPLRPYWQANTMYLQLHWPVVWHQKMHTTPRRSEEEEEEQSDFDPQQLTLINYAKRAEHVTSSDSMLKLTANRETLMHRASEEAAFAWTVAIGQFYITNESVMDGCSSTPLFTEFSEPRNSQNSRGQAILNDHVKTAELKYSTLLELWSQKYEYRHDNQGIWSLGCLYHEELNSAHDNLFPKILNAKILEPCFRRSRWGAGDREHRRKVNICQYGKELRHCQRFYRWGFGERNWKNNLSKRKNTKEIVNSRTFTTRRKSRMEYCEDQNGTISTFVHCKATVMGCNLSKLVLFETDTVQLEETHIPHGQLFQLLDQS